MFFLIKEIFNEISIKFTKNLIFENLLEINLFLSEKNFFIPIDINYDFFSLNENFNKISFSYEKFVISKCKKNFSKIQTKNLKINNLIINKRLHNFTEFSKSDFFIRTYFFNNISNSFHFFLRNFISR